MVSDSITINSPDFFVRRDLKSSFVKTLENFRNNLGPVFRFDNSSPLDVSVDPSLLSQGAFIRPNKVRVRVSEDTRYSDAQCCSSCWNRWLDTRNYILAHEIGHSYHNMVNPDFHDRYLLEKFDEKDTEKNEMYLGELVADLSALRNFDLDGRLSQGVSSAMMEPDGWETYYLNYPAAAVQFYRNNRHQIDAAIHYLATSSYPEVKSAIDPYKEYLHSISGSNYLINFGMCVKVTDLQGTQLTLFD